MKVKAIRKGYYGLKLRKPGEIFEINSDKELGNWMQPVGEDGKPMAKAKADDKGVLKKKSASKLFGSDDPSDAA